MAAYGRGAVARPIVAVEIASGSLVFTTYALLDCGANCCGISKDMVLKLKLKTQTDDCTLTIWNDIKTEPTDTASFTASFTSGLIPAEAGSLQCQNVFFTQRVSKIVF